MLPRLGAHMSIAGGHDKAVQAAASLGCEALQVFTKSTNRWAAKPLTDQQVAAFRTELTRTGIAATVAHNSYLINLASPDDALWERSIESMVLELERAEALGISDLVTHPGAHVGSGEEAGLDRIARALDEVHRRTSGVQARIALETTAGQGSCLGHRFEHLGRILELVREPERLGVCVDTCHVFAAGYSFDEPDQYNVMMSELEAAVGPGRVRVWHLNDSVRERGSRVDRHAGLGRGKIGVEPFRLIVTDPRHVEVPMILETPKGLEDGVELDAINLGILRKFRDESAVPGRAREGRRMTGESHVA